MVIETSRFGKVTIPAEEVISFAEGILGFADLKKFVLLDDPSDEIFAWLQSCELPQIAFPVLEPELFVENFKIGLTKSDLAALKVDSNVAKEDVKVTGALRYFTIVTIPEDPTQMTANLKAPLVINVSLKIGRQCVLQDNQQAIKEPIFAKLQQRVMQNPTVAIKNQSSGIDMAVRLNLSSINASATNIESLKDNLTQ